MAMSNNREIPDYQLINVCLSALVSRWNSRAVAECLGDIRAPSQKQEVER